MNIASKKSIGFVFLSIAVLYILTLWYGWAYAIWWIDVVLHIMGGAWIAQLFLWAKNRYMPHIDNEIPAWFYLLLVLGSVMFVGVAWEWFEYALDAFISAERFGLRQQLGLRDTLGDLIADVVGGLAVVLYSMYNVARNEELEVKL
jgi:hypothetical protein